MASVDAGNKDLHGNLHAKPSLRSLSEERRPRGTEGSNDVVEALIRKYTASLPLVSRSGEPTRSGEPITVAITGTTGNLGCNMLNRLVEDPNVGRIICLNRAADGKDAQDAAFVSNRLPQVVPPAGGKPVEHYRIDLSQPLLGLTQEQYAAVREGVDVLVHNAWKLNFLRDVRWFEQAHIAGVRHIVDLAAGSPRDMRIVFVSSIAAVSGTSRKVHEAVPEEPAGSGVRPGPNGYSQGKYVSEKILEAAAVKSKVKASIVRVGQVAGPVGDAEGSWSESDWFPRIMKSAKVLRAVPGSPGMMDMVDWIPINSLADVMMDIVSSARTDPSPSQQPLSVYHIVNPHVMPWKDLAPGVARYLGDDVRVVPLAEWITLLKQAMAEREPRSLPVEPLLPWLELIDRVPKMAGLEVKRTVALSPKMAAAGPVQVPWLERWMAAWGL